MCQRPIPPGAAIVDYCVVALGDNHHRFSALTDTYGVAFIKLTDERENALDRGATRLPLTAWELRLPRATHAAVGVSR